MLHADLLKCCRYCFKFDLFAKFLYYTHIISFQNPENGGLSNAERTKKTKEQDKHGFVEIVLGTTIVVVLLF